MAGGQSKGRRSGLAAGRSSKSYTASLSGAETFPEGKAAGRNSKSYIASLGEAEKLQVGLRKAARSNRRSLMSQRLGAFRLYYRV